jgi:hypothetical protein
MKFRLIALIITLALSLVGWAQVTPAASAAPNSTPAPQAQAQSCCHHKMADMKDGKSCCHHGTADAKDAEACCGKDKCDMKDGKSCCEGKDAKTAMKECKKNGCCKDGKCCEGNNCGSAKGDKTAKACCGNKCEKPTQASVGS